MFSHTVNLKICFTFFVCKFICIEIRKKKKKKNKKIYIYIYIYFAIWYLLRAFKIASGKVWDFEIEQGYLFISGSLKHFC